MVLAVGCKVVWAVHAISATLFSPSIRMLFGQYSNVFPDTIGRKPTVRIAIPNFRPDGKLDSFCRYHSNFPDAEFH